MLLILIKTKSTVMINDPFLLVITCQLDDESLLNQEIIKQKQHPCIWGYMLGMTISLPG